MQKLNSLKKESINKDRFDQLAKSLTMRMGNSATEELNKLQIGDIDFSKPL